jgi:putative transposase
MPRVARVVVPGLPHHVTQRGNNRQDVFFTNDDRRFYLKLLREQSSRYDLKIRAYCLMTNHVHLVVVPGNAASLAKTLASVHLKYAQYLNRMHGRCGHLWQSRFYSCVLQGRHELEGVRYVERNPVRARLVRLAWRYPWSSAAAHCGAPDASGVLELTSWRQRCAPRAWRSILQRPDDSDIVTRLRRSTFNGRPLGDDRFIAKLETRLNRRLQTPKMGRPRQARQPRQPRRVRPQRRRKAQR